MKKLLPIITVVIVIAITCLSTFAGSTWPVVQNDDSGANVKALQYLLNYHGYDLDEDGDFGPATLKAVKAFQSKNGLDNDGIVGKNTWLKLIVTVKNGSKNDAVKAVQYILNVKSGKSLDVDGVFGDGTEKAVISFQKSKGLDSDGIVGANTWLSLIGNSANVSDDDFWGKRSNWLHPLKDGPTSNPNVGGRQFGASRSSGRYHAGIDFTAPAGRSVIAMTSGKVTAIYQFYEGTYAIEVKNTDGTVARYCEVSSSVKVGNSVSKGQVIAKVMKSNTGSQMLHLEIYQGTSSGSLTDRDNNTYKYVNSRNYERRSDLQNPTGSQYLTIVK